MPLPSSPWRSAVSVFAGMVLVACGEQTTDPSQPLLLGQWGSETVSLVAIRSGAEVQLPCQAVIIDDPIELRDGSSFTVVGRLQGSSAVLGSLPEVRVTGRLRGTRVHVTVPGLGPYAPVAYDLEAGVVPPPLEAPICPQ